MSSRVALASIPALTFYSDTLTKSRRTAPIPQLTCVGKPCNLFQPDVVRCINEGGHGTDVDWKCEAGDVTPLYTNPHELTVHTDLPETLRFGRVEVSCEGWSGPGDPMVLKGSCGLEYRLIRIPNRLQNDDAHTLGTSGRVSVVADDVLKTIFVSVWLMVLLFILYSFLKSYFSRARNPVPTRPTGDGWFPGHHPDNATNPPPYSRHEKPPNTRTWGAWYPGFWTGLGLGGFIGTWWNRRRDAGNVPPRRFTWDWERQNNWWESSPRRTALPATSSGWFQRAESTSRRISRNDDRGEGPSNLGSLRRSTGWGGSNVR